VASASEQLLTSAGLMEVLPDASDPWQAAQHMQEINSMRRQRAGITADTLRASCQRRTAARLLFHHQPYCHQDQLQLSAADVAALVEVVVGPRQQGMPSAVTGCVEVAGEADARFWALLPPGSSSADSLGQAAACVLVKLAMDLWLAAGPEAAAPLVLRMLQQALQQPLPSQRARAFDLLYNMSLHGGLLRGQQDSEPTSPQHASGSSAGDRYNGAAAAPAPQSPRAQLHIGGPSAPQLSSPHIHLPHQLLTSAPAAGVGGGSSRQGSPSPRSAHSGGSPAPGSPAGSRLARSAAWDADPASPAGAQQPAGGGFGDAATLLSMELAFERWLLGLLFEALLMLAQVSCSSLPCSPAAPTSAPGVDHVGGSGSSIMHGWRCPAEVGP
jgi:hypothetical protein